MPKSISPSFKITAVALGSLALSACDGASSVHEPLAVGTIIDDIEISEAEMEDLAFIAQEKGWSLDEAIERIGWQRAFDEAVAEIRAAYPHRFAGSAITPEGPGQASLGFTGGVPEGVREHPILSGLDVTYRGDLAQSWEALLTQLQTVHHAIRAEGYPDVVSVPTWETGRIEVSVGVGQQSVSKANLLAALPAEAHAANVEITLAPSNPGSLETLYGGGNMNGCTSAFTVRSGSTLGMLTAGHCGNNRLMLDDTGTWRSMTFRGEHEGGWGDFQWHTHPTQDFSTFFHTDTSLRREAWRIGSASKNRDVCRFGMTTGKQCDEVFKTGVSSGGADRLAMMRNDKAEGGDSGGPWYYGNTVYGVHRGGKVSWFKWRDVWSQLTYVDDALGVNVALCTPYQTSCRPGQCDYVPIGCGRTLYCGSCNAECRTDADCGKPGGPCGGTPGRCRIDTCICL